MDWNDSQDSSTGEFLDLELLEDDAYWANVFDVPIHVEEEHQLPQIPTLAEVQQSPQELQNQSQAHGLDNVQSLAFLPSSQSLDDMQAHSSFENLNLSHQLSSNPKQVVNVDEVQEFVKNFKCKRSEMDLTQEEVSLAIGKFCGQAIHKKSMSRFENCQLSLPYMRRLMKLAQRWLEEVEAGCRGSHSLLTLGSKAEEFLERYFTRYPCPNADEITNIAEELGIEIFEVKVWFYTRHQKKNRIKPPTVHSLVSPPSATTSEEL